MRAMSVISLCIFLDIDATTWRDYREKQDFSTIVARVDEIIRTQKFQGAAADLLNPNIIARDLGLSEKSVVDQTTTHEMGASVADLMKAIDGRTRSK